MWERAAVQGDGAARRADATAATWSASRGRCATAWQRPASRSSRAGQRRQARHHASRRFAPRFTPRPGPRAGGRRSAGARHRRPQRSPIVGGGLAGCALAGRLAERGWRSRPCSSAVRALAAGRLGQCRPALFHGVVHAHDGAHARFNRAAAYEARRGGRAIAIAAHGVAGSTSRAAAPASRGTDAAPHRRRCSTRLGLPAGLRAALVAERSRAIARHRRRRPGLALRRAAAGSSRAAWRAPMLDARRRAHRLPSAGARRRSAATRRRPLAAPRCGRPRARDGASRGPGQRRRTRSTCSAAPLAAASQSRPDQRLAAHAGRRPLPCACRSPAPATCCRRSTALPGSAPARTKDDDDPAPCARRPPRQPRAPRRPGRPSRRRCCARRALRGRVGWRWTQPRPAAADRRGAAGARAELGASRRRRVAATRAAALRAAGAGPVRVRGAGFARHRRLALGAQAACGVDHRRADAAEADLLDAVDPARFASRAFRRAGPLPGAAG